MRRVREAICYFSDCAWRRHPDDRAIGAYRQVLMGAYVAADHHERAVMAAALYFRYAGDRELPEEDGIASLLDDESLHFARVMGLAARLAFGISGSLRGILPVVQLQLTRDAVILQLPPNRKALAAESVNKRLDGLAEAFGKKPQIAVA